MGKAKKSQQVQAGPAGKPTPRPASDIQRRALSLVPDSILSLTTTAPTRPTITIDGMAFYEDFALWQHLKMQAFAERVNEFDALALDDEAREVTPEMWAELEVAQIEAYGEIVRIVLPDLPEPTLLALNLSQRRAIASAFFAATAPATPDQGTETPTETEPEAAAE
jgi:hypothetical protein